jgi:hypothetical protein
MASDRDPDRASDAERAEAREEEVMYKSVRAAYRQPSAADEPARERLLARLAAERGAQRTTASPAGLRWWFAAGAFQTRPAWALATIVAVLAAGMWLGARLTAGRDGVHEATRTALLPASADAGTAPVTFVLRAPGATRVSVVGDFNNWDAEATPMAHSGSGDTWVLSVRLPRGVHLYSFVLDGSEWRPDPSAPLAADGSFGGHNSVVVVDGAKGL